MVYIYYNSQTFQILLSHGLQISLVSLFRPLASKGAISTLQLLTFGILQVTNIGH